MEYGKWLNPIVGLLGLIVAIIALVPSFLSLRRNEPKVYFASSLTEIQLPDGMDTSNVLDTLSKNGIPHGLFQIQIINNGEGPVSELKLRIQIAAVKGRYKTVPESTDYPAWIVIQTPTVSNDPNQMTISQNFKDVAVGESLKANVWFEHLSPDSLLGTDKLLTDVQVYYDGKEGIYVDDISKATKVSWLSHFRIPGIVVGVSFALMLCIAILTKLKNDPSFRKTIYDLFLGDTVGLSFDAASQVLKALASMSDNIAHTRKTQKDKTEKENS